MLLCSTIKHCLQCDAVFLRQGESRDKNEDCDERCKRRHKSITFRALSDVFFARIFLRFHLLPT
jgi:hypothetical protein